MQEEVETEEIYLQHYSNFCPTVSERQRRKGDAQEEASSCQKYSLEIWPKTPSRKRTTTAVFHQVSDEVLIIAYTTAEKNN